MPFSEFVDSTLRHVNQFLMGMEDEDHVGQAIFNLMCIIHFQETGRVDLDDMPKYFLKDNVVIDSKKDVLEVYPSDKDRNKV